MSIPAPRCSCIICHKEQSSKGIHSHYLVVHTEEGRDRLLKASKIQPKYPTKQQIDAVERRADYINNPNFCKHCKSILQYDKRNNSFCSKSCAATFNNLKETQTELNKRITKLRLTLSEKVYPTKVKSHKSRTRICFISFCAICKCLIKGKIKHVLTLIIKCTCQIRQWAVYLIHRMEKPSYIVV